MSRQIKPAQINSIRLHLVTGQYHGETFHPGSSRELELVIPITTSLLAIERQLQLMVASALNQIHRETYPHQEPHDES